MSGPPNTKDVNASGMTQAETKKLPTREPSAEEKRILESVNELYRSQATEHSYSVYDEQAVFHDPVGLAEGLGRIREQFNGLAKLFEKSTIDKQNVLDAPSFKKGFLVDQDVTYYTKADKDPVKTVNSLLTLEVNSSGKIIRHSGEKDSKDGVLGWMSEIRKKMTVAATGAFLPQDPSKI